MIHIAGLILKIIGIVLLVLLALFLFCIITFLCIPARYHGSLCVQEETSAGLVINGPLFFYRLRVEFKNWQFRYKFRVFGIPVLKNKKSEKTKKKTRKRKKKEVKPKGIFGKIKYTFHKFCVKIKKVWNNSKELAALLEKDVTREALGDLKRETGTFLKLFRPKKLRGYVEFGTGDPAVTGQILGMISIFYFGLFPDVTLYPLFDERKFAAQLSVKGSLNFRKMLGCIIRLYGNRKIKYVYKKISNLGGNKHVK